MDGDRLAQFGLVRHLPAGFLQRGNTDRFRRIMTREQPAAWPRQSVVGAQLFSTGPLTSHTAPTHAPPQAPELRIHRNAPYMGLIFVQITLPVEDVGFVSVSDLDHIAIDLLIAILPCAPKGEELAAMAGIR